MSMDFMPGGRMSINDKLNTWFDQFIQLDSNAGKDEKEQWALHSLTTMSQLFDNVYGEIPNKPATSKIQTFLTILIQHLRAMETPGREAILDKLYLLKSAYSDLLAKLEPGARYLNCYPHNYNVFYVDFISILQKFPEYKPVIKEETPAEEMIDHALLTQAWLDETIDQPISERISHLLSAIPLNANYDKQLNQTKDILIAFIKKHTHSIEHLTDTIDELLSTKYDYLRKDKNLFRTLTSTFTRNHTWAIILDAIKQRTLDILRTHLVKDESINDETWLLAETIIHERGMTAALFRDQYIDEFESLHRKYMLEHNAEQVI